MWRAISHFYLGLLLLCPLLSTVHGEGLEPLLNLEKRFASNVVLSTKRVSLPGHPNAFNPSIAIWQGKCIMSFREIPNRLEKYRSQIGLVWLNEEGDPISFPQIVETNENGRLTHSRAEDARLIVIGEKLYMVYSDNPFHKLSRGGFRMYIAEVEWDGISFSLHHRVCFNEFEGNNSEVREKNWVPFNYREQLLLSYSVTPHKVFIPDLLLGSCQTQSLTYSDIRWPWGIVRGGTPALLEEKSYLSFFHSSIDLETQHSSGKKILHYFIGAYLFSQEPPFHITHISAQPIVGDNFYEGESYQPYWKPVKALFPCGYVSNEDRIWLSYGRDDHEIWIATLDKKELYATLIPVVSVSLSIP
ncbi:MAG: hypothetical protein QRY74_05690 [Chlamydia sp.]